MDRLSRTVEKAVAKMKEKKNELRRLHEVNVRLNAEFAKADAVYAKKMRDLQIKLTPWVDCIRQTEHTFLRDIDPSEYYRKEAEIEKKLLQLQSGLSNMYLFVRAKGGVEPMLHVSEDGSKIIFREMSLNNPFDEVFQGVDRIETPGLQNFKRFEPKLIKDIQENEKLFLSFYGPSGTGKTTMMRQVFLCVWEELVKKVRVDIEHFICNSKVKVQQLYVRSHLANPIPLTAGSDMREGTATGLHELFNLKKVGEDDVVKVYLNNVQMIHSVGCELYKHSRKLYRLLSFIAKDEDVRSLLFIKGNSYELHEENIYASVAYNMGHNPEVGSLPANEGSIRC